MELRETAKMVFGWIRLKKQLCLLHDDETGQDLVEYALVAVIIALAAAAGMGTVAKGINDVFSNVAKRIVGYGS